MKRRLTALAMTVALQGCGPENSPPRCEGKADFLLDLSAPSEVFPNDTKIEVTFGGGSTETYWLSAPNDPKVLFCEIVPALGMEDNAGGGGSVGGEAGARSSAWTGGQSHGGAGGMSREVRSISCEIWSAGPATVTIRAGSWHTTRELKRDPEVCTSHASIVLGEPDPKP